MDSPLGVALSAEDFGLKGPRGWAFRGVGFSARPGSLIAIEGDSGSGRTCLLLALTGRMRSTHGHAEVGGVRLPGRLAAVRRFSALGPVAGVSELDPSLTVGEHLRERTLLRRRFDDSFRSLLLSRARRTAAAKDVADAALDAAGLDLADLPKSERTQVRDLERLAALRLSVALALTNGPGLLAVDDTDLGLGATDRASAWELLRSVAAAGTTVLAVCTEAPEGSLAVRSRPGNVMTAADGRTAGTTDASDSTDADAADADPDADPDADDNEKGKADAIAEAGRA
ncbi:ATP-binding cassette domain-containing protein [Streptomyces sp. NPDC048305]|uniref:ATP-binding cassette domain-containing protein n=1 Tax=Streptomyces sp. NPDC048305 TaxID=3365532 RepID=UPI00371DACCA